MATNSEVSEIEALPDDEFTFSDSLISTIDFVFDDESLPTTFISDDDVIELIGAQEFPCNLCQRICRSKSGLEVHIERNHYSLPKEPFLKAEDFVVIAREIKENALKENMYSAELIERLPSEVPLRLQSFINNLLSHYKNDHDSFYTKYSTIFVKTLEFFPERSVEETNLFLLKLATAVLYHVKKGMLGDVENSCDKGLRQEERGPLAYVAGSVISQIYKKAVFHKRKSPWQEEIKSLFAKTLSVETSRNAFIASMDRGGLWAPSTKLMGIIEIVENTFRRLTKSTPRSIPIDDIMKSCLCHPSVISIWNSVMLDHDENQISTECSDLCLQMIIKLFVRIRGFSHTKDIWKRHLAQQHLEKKQKALRKTLKKKAEESQQK